MSLEVLPADVPADYAPTMVAACSDSIGEGSCAMAASLPESTRPEAVALVLWLGEGYPVGFLTGAALGLPRTGDDSADAERLVGPTVETQLMAGLEVPF